MADYFWTEHAKFKMRQYGLSEQRVNKVIRAPFRVEEGIVKNTVAVMIPTGKFVLPKAGEKPAWKQETWVMYQIGAKSTKLKVKRIKIISAWRYPGVSPKNNPIPEDILREILKVAR
jgi:hypothetical protein